MTRNWSRQIRYGAAIAAAGVGAGVALVAVGGSSAATGPAPSAITGGQMLTDGQTIASPDGHYDAVLSSGVLSVRMAGGRQLYSVGTSSPGAYAVLQPNGLFVIFSAEGDVLYSSGETGTGCPVLEMQLDGNLVDYDTKAIWSSGTDEHGLQAGDYLYPGWSLYPHGVGYQLEMESDGDLEIHNDSGTEIWSSGTSGNPGAYAAMQADGNFVVYAANGKALWSTKTYHNPGASLTFSSSGGLYVSTSAGKELWGSGSTGKPGSGTPFSVAPAAASSTPCPSTSPIGPTNTVTTTQTVLVPTTTQVTVTTPAVTHTRQRRVEVRFTVGFSYLGSVTHLKALRFSRLPRGVELTTDYKARGRRRALVHRARTAKQQRALLAELRRQPYRAGETLTVTLSRRGYRPEAVRFTFRAGGLPKFRQFGG